MKVLFSTCGGWHLPHTAKAFENRDALAALWITASNRVGISPVRYRRCWPHFLATIPLYLYAPQVVGERAFYAFLPLWKFWQQRQRWSDFQVFQSIMGFASEGFDQADKVGALKVVDCPNSHPTTYYGYWQRECDLWCPGEKIPIPRWMFARMNRELQRADLVLCPSQFVRDTMVTNGIPPEKCFINPFGVDTSVFKPRTAPPANPRFICVGTICLRKGHQYLFRAFEQLRAQLPNAELICVGPVKCDFRKEWPKWAGRFTHHRSLPHAKLSELLQTCTAFVLPSCEEGFARVLSEAMACGLPIIASYESGATTQVTDGVEGLIVSHQPEAIAAAMLRLARDAELNHRMGTAAHQRGALRNTWQDYGDRLLAEYQVRLEQKTKAAGKPIMPK